MNTKSKRTLKQTPFIKTITAVALSLFVQAAAAGSQTYPLVCAGSAQNNLTVASIYGRLSLSVGFSKWNKPAGPTMPAGYCSWTDRGMRSNEPAVLTYYPDVRKAFIAVSYSPASKGGRFQYTPPCIGVCGDYDMNVGLFQKLLTAGDGHTFSVYNDGNGAMVFVP